MKPSDQLQDIIPDVVKTLKRIFTETEHSEDDLAIARIAAGTLSTWAKLKQTEGGQEAMYYSMARDIANSPDQLAHYIHTTLPDVPLAKELPTKKLPKGKTSAQ